MQNGAETDTLRKLVLRKVALNVGLPDALVDKPKKAVQYSTGINDAIKTDSEKSKAKQSTNT